MQTSETRPEVGPAGSPRREETAEQRSVRRCAIVDPLMKKAGIRSDSEWAEKAGTAMDRNTPRDYRNGKTKRPRKSTRIALAAPLGVDESELPE